MYVFKPPLSSEKVAKMEELYNLNAAKNSEIRFRYLDSLY